MSGTHCQFAISHCQFTDIANVKTSQLLIIDLSFLPHDAMLSTVYATAIPSVNRSVRLSVTRVDYIKTAEC